MDARTPALRDRIGLDGRKITGILTRETRLACRSRLKREEEIKRTQRVLHSCYLPTVRALLLT